MTGIYALDSHATGTIKNNKQDMTQRQILVLSETKSGFSMWSLEYNCLIFYFILKKFGFRKYSVPAPKHTFGAT